MVWAHPCAAHTSSGKGISFINQVFFKFLLCQNAFLDSEDRVVKWLVKISAPWSLLASGRRKATNKLVSYGVCERGLASAVYGQREVKQGRDSGVRVQVDAAVLSQRAVREGLSEMTFEPMLERDEGTSHKDIWVRVFQEDGWRGQSP